MHFTSDAASRTAENETIVERCGALGRIRLNRPKALNSLTLPMIRDMDAALDRFARDPAVAAVLIIGEGERGLCAGGDIRAIHDSGKNGSDLASTFWSEEYRLNARISSYPKPYIAFMDGIVMGGGVGVSVYGSHRIVTERTRLAMPETGIGFFPDIGASWFLTRQAGEGTTHLALTGEIIGAGDAIALGLADTYVPSADLAVLAEALAALPAGSGRAEVSGVVARFAAAAPAGPVSLQRQAIDRLFAHDRVENILAALDEDGSDFAAKAAATLRTKSPLSLAVTLRLLRLGRQSERLEDCLEREFAATPAVLASHDFYEGVRAAIIDKDRNPQWRPASLDAVTAAEVDAYFPAEHAGLFAD
jgi:enoyl-CoA hydratase